MNNSIDQDDECFVMDSKPIITCTGDSTLWKNLENSLVETIPQEATEWRRSLGRPLKNVHVSASFVPFSVSALPHEGNWDLIRQPILHIYWTECADTDTYKVSVREDLEAWLKELNHRNIVDWMIVVVETYDTKRTNKLLPRTTVLDKIRSDFAVKQGDRCLSVINPLRPDFLHTDSWRGLVTRIRILLLSAYNRALSHLEDHVRDQREKRTQPSWDFCQYFLLQEELALVLEMLGLYEEALVQYDELDALFTQFVVNAHMGEATAWLGRFQKPIEQWRALVLGRSLTREQRAAVLANGPAPLLEFRAYLFSRQAAMLLFTCKPWEVAQRCLPFLHTCVRELDLLDVSVPTGALPCWLLLACQEVLRTCDKFNDSEQVDAYSLYTADLWAYATDKLQILGQLCGLLPGSEPTSEQLHLVVGLSAGMGDCPGTPAQPTPTDKLKETLCSKEVFYKHYLELAELSMGTYKHIGRVRSARAIGRELASFYLLQGQTANAISFLSDSLSLFDFENWRDLAAQTQLELASCFNKQLDQEKYIYACIEIASALELELLVRNFYFDEMIKCLKNVSEKKSDSLFTSFKDTFKVLSLEIDRQPEEIMQDSELEIKLDIENNFPREIFCNQALFSLEKYKEKENKKLKFQSSCTYNDIQPQDKVMSQLHVTEHFDRKQDGRIGSANVVCNQFNKVVKQLPPEDFTVDSLNVLESNIALKPGINTLKTKFKLKNQGIYRLGALTLELDTITFRSNTVTPNILFKINRLNPSVTLDKIKDLIAGVEQPFELILKNGSFEIEKGATIKLWTSSGLNIQMEEVKETLLRELTIVLPSIPPFETVIYKLRFLCDFPPKKDEKHIEQTINIQCSWMNKDQTVLLYFCPLFKSIWKLHTARLRKYIQIVLTGLTTCSVLITQPILQCGKLNLISLNTINGLPVVLRKNFDVSFMWEVEVDNNEKADPVKSEFYLNYTVQNDSSNLNNNEKLNYTTYKMFFEIANYKTLFMVRTNIEPSKGSELCRSGTMCHLSLTVHRANRMYQGSLMYEVLADQSMWAVCGRTAGVIMLENDEPQNITLDVMPLTSGHMPLPIIRLSKYIPAEQHPTDKHHKIESASHPKLEPFSTGQVYNYSKAQQVHVIAAANDNLT